MKIATWKQQLLSLFSDCQQVQLPVPQIVSDRPERGDPDERWPAGGSTSSYRSIPLHFKKTTTSERLQFHPASSPAVYSCALLRDILLQGRLYISRNWLCFYANLFGKDIKVSGPTDWLQCASPLFPSRIINASFYFAFLCFLQYRSESITWCWISRTSSRNSVSSNWIEPISILRVGSYACADKTTAS